MGVKTICTLHSHLYQSTHPYSYPSTYLHADQAIHTPTLEAAHVSAPILVHPSPHFHPPLAAALKVSNSANVYPLLPCALPVRDTKGIEKNRHGLAPGVAPVWHRRQRWSRSRCASRLFLPVTVALRLQETHTSLATTNDDLPHSSLSTQFLGNLLSTASSNPLLQPWNRFSQGLRSPSETEKMWGTITLKSLSPNRLLMEEVIERM